MRTRVTRHRRCADDRVERGAMMRQLPVWLALATLGGVYAGTSNLWLATLLCGIVGIVSSELYRARMKGERPFTDLLSFTTLPLLGLIVLSIVMLLV